jgi:hypothetical protein
MFAGYTPTRAQAAVLSSAARFLIVIGAIRSGKTLVAVLKGWRRILEDIASGKSHPMASMGGFNKHTRPRLNYWIVAPTYLLLGQSFEYLDALVPKEMIVHRIDGHENVWWLRHPTGGVVRLTGRSAEDASRLVSQPVDGVIFDEMARASEVAWNATRGRLIDTKGWLCAASSPFGSVSSHVYQLAYGGAPDVETHTLRLADNPVVEGAELERLKLTMSSRAYERDVMASWKSGGVQVYEEFSPLDHVITRKELFLLLGIRSDAELLGAFKRIVIAIDWGWFPSPTAMLAIGESRRDGHLYALEELVATKTPTVSEHGPSRLAMANDLRRRWGSKGTPVEFVADPEEPQSIDAFARAGLNITGAKKDILMGVGKVANVLHVNPQTKRPLLRVLDECKQTIKELSALTWRVDRDGLPIEGEFDPRCSDHLGGDALRYGIVFMRRDENDGLPRIASPVSMLGVGTFMGSRLR